MKLGVVANARSWRNRRAGARADPGGDALFEAPELLEDYPAALARFAEAGVDVVAIDGGDGTVRDVLSALIPAYAGRTLPAVALLPAGKTNVLAADVGHAGHGAAALARLSAAVHAGTAMHGAVVRRPLRVTTDRRDLHGFVFGCGAYAKATRLVNERVNQRGFAQKLGLGLGLAASAAAVLVGRESGDWRRGAELAIGLDGAEPDTRATFVLLATTLHRLMLGVWPFWGTGASEMKLLDVAAPPHRLALALAPALAGRPRPWMTAAHGYRSSRPQGVTLRLEERFIVDGDPFAPGSDGRVELLLGPRLTFVRP